jgi:uncharacterized membrane protein
MQTTENDGIPPGWSYNPSTWGQRISIILLAVVGTVIAGYLALYQLEMIETVWEPFFGKGSETILNSGISDILPIPDAALGAIAYIIDAITGIIGGTRRWRTMPWMVILFGIAVGPLGLVSILLVVLQPVLFSSWCTLCLSSAVISVWMIGPAMDETLASLQYMKQVRNSGRSVWKAFWGKEETGYKNK